MLLRTRCGRRVRFRSSSVGTRQECRVSLRGFGLGLESGRVGDAPLPKLRPDGWDCHFPTDVKDHAPQDCYPWNAFIIPKTDHDGAVKFWNAFLFVAFTAVRQIRRGQN